VVKHLLMIEWTGDRRENWSAVVTMVQEPGKILRISQVHRIDREGTNMPIIEGLVPGINVTLRQNTVNSRKVTLLPDYSYKFTKGSLA